MELDKKKIIETIKKSFEQVNLEDGIGLLEANAMDNYDSIGEIKKYREKDEKEFWDRIPVNRLNDCYYSLSYFDAKGLKFHLPAFMIATLKNNEYRFDLVCKLINLSEYSLSQFKLLSKNQKNAVKLFLEYMKDENYQLDKEEIEKSINKFWSK